jgi:hypothetical protein
MRLLIGLQHMSTMLQVCNMSTLLREWVALHSFRSLNALSDTIMNPMAAPSIVETTAPNTMETADSVPTSLNELQTAATHKAIGLKEGFLLLSGPPGTGKTKTTVATICGLLEQDKCHHRVLLCAPSNAAVDEVVVRLLQVAPHLAVLRLGAVEVRAH